MMVTSNVFEMDYIHTLDTHSLDTHKTCIQKQEYLAWAAFIFINDLEKGQGYWKQHNFQQELQHVCGPCRTSGHKMLSYWLTC